MDSAALQLTEALIAKRSVTPNDAGCQALLTGEARFHACLEARTTNFGLILPGHYATERLGIRALGEHLAERFELAHEFVEVENPV